VVEGEISETVAEGYATEGEKAEEENSRTFKKVLGLKVKSLRRF